MTTYENNQSGKKKLEVNSEIKNWNCILLVE